MTRLFASFRGYAYDFRGFAFIFVHRNLTSILTVVCECCVTPIPSKSGTCGKINILTECSKYPRNTVSFARISFLLNNLANILNKRSSILRRGAEIIAFKNNFISRSLWIPNHCNLLFAALVAIIVLPAIPETVRTSHSAFLRCLLVLLFF